MKHRSGRASLPDTPPLHTHQPPPPPPGHPSLVIKAPPYILFTDMKKELGADALTAFRDLGSEVDVDAVFGAEVGVVSQRRAQAAAAAVTGLVTALLLVEVWTDVGVTRREHAPHQDFTVGRVEH